MQAASGSSSCETGRTESAGLHDSQVQHWELATWVAGIGGLIRLGADLLAA